MSTNQPQLPQLPHLHERRAQLVALAAAQRRELAQQIAPLRQPAEKLDKALAVGRVLLRFARQHPIVTLAGSALALRLGRKGRVGKWLQYGWLGWRLLQKLRSK